jgi:hypothetical protein
VVRGVSLAHAPASAAAPGPNWQRGRQRARDLRYTCDVDNQDATRTPRPGQQGAQPGRTRGGRAARGIRGAQPPAAVLFAEILARRRAETGSGIPLENRPGSYPATAPARLGGQPASPPASTPELSPE